MFGTIRNQPSLPRPTKRGTRRGGFNRKTGIRFMMLVIVLSIWTPSWIIPSGLLAASSDRGAKADAVVNNSSEAAGGRRVQPTATSTPATSITPASTSAYDHCIQDDADPSKGVSFNSVTGAFEYNSGGQTLFTGTGRVSTLNGCTTFSGRTGNNSVSVTYSGTGCNSASATITWNYSPGLYQTIKISDSNVSGNDCATGPSVSLLSPNGGEILDVGTAFNIMWAAFDLHGITSEDILLSTNGGSSFSNVVTGLGRTATSYAWTVPAIANNTSAVVQVAVHNAMGVTATAQSAAPFTIWNPAAAYTHVAEAPLYLISGSLATLSGGGNNATSLAAVQDSDVEICNESSSSLSVELAVRERSGNAGAPAPVTFTVSAQTHRTVALSSLFAFTANPITFTGSLRLRHNGASDADIRALMLIDSDNDVQSFAVPLVYPASAQSASGTVQYSPMYYVGGAEPSTKVALQNATNSPVTTNVTLQYGDGGLAGTAGQLSLSPITLYAQQTAFVDLSQLAGSLQGSTWGSVKLTAAPQSVVAYVVSRDLSDGMAFGHSFGDPAMCSKTSMTATGLSIDSATGRAACLMVCNESGSSRTVNVSYQSDCGISIPSSQLTLSAGQQQMVELTPSQVLPGGGSTMADARITYSGNPGDIMAGVVSMSSANSRAVPAQFVETSSSDGRRLVAPFFWFDERVAGIVQVSNLGTSTVKAGVMMDFDDQTLLPLNTDVISIPAGGTATLNLQNYFSVFEDGVTAQGCLEVVHNGAPGTVAAAFVALGVFSGIGLGIPLTGGPQFGNTEMDLFPNQVGLGNDAPTQLFSAMVGSSLSAPSWSVSSTTGSAGSISPQTQTDPLVFAASYTAPSDPTTLTVTVKADATASGGPIDSAAVAVRKVKLIGFGTSAGHARLSNSNSTAFTLTSNPNTPFPNDTLSVTFRQSGAPDVPATGVKMMGANTLTGTAPPQNSFIKDCTVLVFDSSGHKISKDNLTTANPDGGAYYAYDPPGNATAVSPSSHDRSKVDPLTITGTGYQQFTPAGGPPVFPTVFVGANLLGGMTNVTSSQITGTLSRNETGEKSCTPGVKCKGITVGNPGHRQADIVPTDSLYELQMGPPPTINSITPNSGLSIGGTEVTIGGDNLDFVYKVTLGGKPLTIESGTQGIKSLKVKTLPNCAGNAFFAVTNIDEQTFNYNIPGVSAFTFNVSPVTVVRVLGQSPRQLNPIARYFAYVGPCPSEGIDKVNVSAIAMKLNGNPLTTPCVTATFSPTRIPLPDPGFPNLDSSLNLLEIDISLTVNCQGGNPPGSNNYSGTFTFQLGNTANITDTSLWTPQQTVFFAFSL
jgi:hypothetical protein